MLRVAGSLDCHLGREHAGVQSSGREDIDGGGADEVGKSGWSHRSSLGERIRTSRRGYSRPGVWNGPGLPHGPVRV
ncbi:hypothetical protein GCM10018954_035190 [Kutzneria kofuensis]